MPFKNRVDAGLAKALAGYRKLQPVVLALPRGGVPVASEVCAALKAPLDLILVRKVGVPFQPELAMGAVVDGSTHHAFHADPLVFTSEAISTVFQFLSDKITPGEIEHVHHALPADIRALWPISSRAA
jgi:predicted phosphoribosyltransferase